jgi:hypothetical protein
MLKIGFSGVPGSWTGVVRDGKKIVVECGHLHPNRDSASTYKTAAMQCMQQQVKTALWPHVRKHYPANALTRVDIVCEALNNQPVQFYGQVFYPVGYDPMRGAS